MIVFWIMIVFVIIGLWVFLAKYFDNIGNAFFKTVDRIGGADEKEKKDDI